MAFLSVEQVSRRFGGIVALDAVSLDLEQGQIGGLIGPNGAGKTTLFNVVTRLYKAERRPGALRRTRPAARPPAPGRRSLGITRTFQNVVLFDRMRCSRTCWSERTPAGDRFRRATQCAQNALETLAYLGLADDRRAPGGGSAVRDAQARRARARARRRGRACCCSTSRPAGSTTRRSPSSSALIQRIRTDFDLTILLVEHHMKLVMRVCERVHVLDFGRKIAEGTPAEVQSEPGRDRGVPGERSRDAA